MRVDLRIGVLCGEMLTMGLECVSGVMGMEWECELSETFKFNVYVEIGVEEDSVSGIFLGKTKG